MEDNITELKKICENLDVLKNNLFHIFLFYKGCGLRRIRFYELEKIAEKFITISNEIKKNNSSDLGYCLANIENKVEEIAKYLERNKLNTEESKKYFDWITENIKEINMMCMFL